MSEKNSVTLINKGFSQKYGKSSISIKTRIETPFLQGHSVQAFVVKVVYPLKQGKQ